MGGRGGAGHCRLLRAELIDVVEGLADNPCHDCQIGEYTSSPDGVWEHKYIYNDYAERKAREARGDIARGAGVGAPWLHHGTLPGL